MFAPGINNIQTKKPNRNISTRLSYDVYAYFDYAGEIAPLGHASTQVPQSAQVSGSIE